MLTFFKRSLLIRGFAILRSYKLDAFHPALILAFIKALDLTK